MKKTDLLKKIKELIRADEELNPEMKLNDIDEWDSLAKISIISLYDRLFSTVVTMKKLNHCSTVNDLLNMVSKHVQD